MLSCRFRPDRYLRLQENARARGLTLSAWVRQALEAQLARDERLQQRKAA